MEASQRSTGDVAAILILSRVELVHVANVLVAVLAGLLAYGIWFVHDYYFTRPTRVLKIFKEQGLPGYDFRPIVGQIPELFQLKKKRDGDPLFAAESFGVQFFIDSALKFGATEYTFCLGAHPRVVVGDPVLVRQMYVTFNDNFGKTVSLKNIKLLENGLLSADGPSWTRQRRLINPAFSHKEIKRLFPTMIQCTHHAMEQLQPQVQANPGEAVLIDHVFSALTLDIIARTAFGSELDNVVGQGHMEELLAASRAHLAVSFPGTHFMAAVAPFVQHLPIGINRQKWALEKQMMATMEKIVAPRMASHKQKTEQMKAMLVDGEEPEGTVDLLELMMSATEGMAEGQGSRDAREDNKALSRSLSRSRSLRRSRSRKRLLQPLPKEVLMTNCMTFLLAGHETTAQLLTWTVMLLSQHPEWQVKAREEVLEVIGADSTVPPTFDQINELKIMGWVLNESLRLYPPGPLLTRQCTKTTKLSEKLTVPEGCVVIIPIQCLARDKELWGEDAAAFRPERFANGVSKAAKHPNAYMPFSVGPRNCIGQAFALIETKIILALFLRTFSWRLADEYVHHPEFALTQVPKFGMPLVLSPLKA